MNGWPRLDYQADRPTIETLHLLLQLIGKLPLRLHPWINHGWHAALRMTPRGAITRPIPTGRQTFTVELDFREAQVRIEGEGGAGAHLPVAGRSVAEVQTALAERLSELHLPAPLHGGPNEMPDPVPFASDTRTREWDADVARRLHAAFLCADRAFNAFRSLYRGKSSPSHLFWGSFDLAVTRFSGRAAPPHPGGVPHLPDTVTREAYSDEVISAGFWPGSAAFEEAAFYAYAYPSPAGLAGAAVEPGAARWQPDLGEFILPYAHVRAAADPEAALALFLHSTFAAAADRLGWPGGMLLSEHPLYGRPPR